MRLEHQPNLQMLAVATIVLLIVGGPARGQHLERSLQAEAPSVLAAEARQLGDAERGAIVFYQPMMACTQCHIAGQAETPLGPDLTKIGMEADDAYLVDSVLHPSKVIKKGFETVMLITADGQTLSGLLESENQERLILRNAARSFQTQAVMKADIEQRITSNTSVMPGGQVNLLASRQQFLDLVRYLIEIRDGGLDRARELEPPPSRYAARPLPEYESRIDHAGMIKELDDDALNRGEAIYNRLCINCHGTHDRPGSLPTSLRFAAGKFKSGNDPYTMYQTLTRGFGMMVPQAWMVPQQKYDVIHYIREAYVKNDNPTQYFPIDADYLASLPRGTERGPEPSDILPWEQMDYGPNLVATYEIGSDSSNFAYKGNAIRLDHGPGGVSQGRTWMIFDYDTLRVAGAWSGEGFIDFNGINFNGRHQVHPRVVGEVHFENPTGPGWANPANGQFTDPRIRGRDDRPYGPLPRSWARYRGMYYHGNDTIISYSVGSTSVLEMPQLERVGLESGQTNVLSRILNIGPRDKEMVLQVARHPLGGNAQPGGEKQITRDDEITSKVVVVGPPPSQTAARRPQRLRFDGNTFLQIDDARRFDLRDEDFTIRARVKTRSGGVIFSKTAPEAEWVRNGKALFVRGGRLTFDIGWVGAVRSRRKVNDGEWHEVAATYSKQSGEVSLYVDGQLDGQEQLKARRRVRDHVVRIGFAAEDFPDNSRFEGQIEEVRFYQKALGREALKAPIANAPGGEALRGLWRPSAEESELVRDRSGRGNDARVVRGMTSAIPDVFAGQLAAGVSGDVSGVGWRPDDDGNLRLVIGPGKTPLRLRLWLAEVDQAKQVQEIVSTLTYDDKTFDLHRRTKGGPPRWPEILQAGVEVGSSNDPFEVDVLKRPTENPWYCRMRLTGFDFFDDGDRAAVCSWEGSVWLVSGLSALPGGQAATASTEPQLTWKRIASGLFQPLGLRIVDGKIYVTCRDQICILHDLNGDGETDFYENFNNDHQVTEHFHEFAMGLQTDELGNFYYAKSARHALPALVPHHGTLLRVSRDGSHTEILANGFRAANGVCLNPDGTFIVTDQEGHWNPKNRINWVTPGGFYGNMYGYHDVEDSSDEAMQQPLCWITNAFDRSPAELLWVDSPVWGPLKGSLLNFSYGYGKVYVVPHEEVSGQKQGGMCELPLPQFPTGIMRGRFHPVDGQLYVCGMFAWAGSQHQPGGFYRIRYTGQEVHLPVGLQAQSDGMRVRFSGRLDRDTSTDATNYRVKVWSLKRTARYGSDHYNEHFLDVASARLSRDGQSVFLEIPDIEPTWCMEIRYTLRDTSGNAVNGVIHNTVHHLSD